MKEEEINWIITDYPIIDEDGTEIGIFRFYRPEYITVILENC